MTAPLRAGPTALYVYFSGIILAISDSCHLQAFEKHVKEFYNSDDFKKKSQEAQNFFKSVRDYVFGRPTTLENSVRLVLNLPIGIS